MSFQLHSLFENYQEFQKAQKFYFEEPTKLKDTKKSSSTKNTMVFFT